MKKLILWTAIFTFILTGCMTPPPVRQNTQSSVLAININIYGSISLSSMSPAIVYFAKLDENEKDLKKQTHIVASNYVYNRASFVYNAEPGTYIAVAAVYGAPNKDIQTILLPGELVQKTVTEVKPGEISYMGSYTLRRHMLETITYNIAKKEYDEYQDHYYKQLSLFKSRVAEFLLGDEFVGAKMTSAERNRKTELHFIEDTIAAAEKTPWRGLYEARLAQLKEEK